MSRRPFAVILLACGLVVSCNRPPETQEAIRQAVIEHLQKNAGLDPNMMQIDIANMSFSKNEAHAQVSFRPKNQPGEGLVMQYTLENKSGKWVVKGKGQSATGMPHSTPNPTAPGGAMPAMPGAGGQGGALPPGHPAIPEADASGGVANPHAPPATKPGSGKQK